MSYHGMDFDDPPIIMRNATSPSKPTPKVEVVEQPNFNIWIAGGAAIAIYWFVFRKK